MKDGPVFCYIMFHDLFPELAEKETRVITVLKGSPDLPRGQYALIELFCEDPGCDCRRVFLDVHHDRSRGSVAVIAYGWEDLAFYRKWMLDDAADTLVALKGPVLNDASPQSRYARSVLGLVERTVLRDEMYIERIKRHYSMFKRALRKRGRGARDVVRTPFVPDHLQDRPKARRGTKGLGKKR